MKIFLILNNVFFIIKWLQVNLKRWHAESQVYVGAFQYLLHKQKLTDQMRNDGNDKSMELQQLMILAKNLLCEIETAINNTRQLMPVVLGRKAMDHRLTFRNNNSQRFENRDADDLDNKFTKVRFHEYLHNMLHVMRRPGKKTLRQRKKKRNELKNIGMNNNNNNVNDSGSKNDIRSGGAGGGDVGDKDQLNGVFNNIGYKRRGGAVVTNLWSAENEWPVSINAHPSRPNRPGKRFRQERHRRPKKFQQNRQISNERDRVTFNWTSDDNRTQMRHNIFGMKRNNNNNSNNNNNGNNNNNNNPHRKNNRNRRLRKNGRMGFGKARRPLPIENTSEWMAVVANREHWLLTNKMKTIIWKKKYEKKKRWTNWMT